MMVICDSLTEGCIDACEHAVPHVKDMGCIENCEGTEGAVCLPIIRKIEPVAMLKTIKPRKVVDYDIFVYAEKDGLIKKVKEYIKYGWETEGGISFCMTDDEDMFCQAMVKYE